MATILSRNSKYFCTRASLERRLFTPDARVYVQGIGQGILQAVERESGCGTIFNVRINFNGENKTIVVRTNE